VPQLRADEEEPENLGTMRDHDKISENNSKEVELPKMERPIKEESKGSHSYPSEGSSSSDVDVEENVSIYIHNGEP
jgi:hypothetical protein